MVLDYAKMQPSFPRIKKQLDCLCAHVQRSRGKRASFTGQESFSWSSNQDWRHTFASCSPEWTCRWESTDTDSWEYLSQLCNVVMSTLTTLPVMNLISAGEKALTRGCICLNCAMYTSAFAAKFCELQLPVLLVVSLASMCAIVLLKWNKRDIKAAKYNHSYTQVQLFFYQVWWNSSVNWDGTPFLRVIWTRIWFYDDDALAVAVLVPAVICVTSSCHLHECDFIMSFAGVWLHHVICMSVTL
jgi:hypothetical protein